MDHYTKPRLEEVIKALEGRMTATSGRAFDRLERARRDLKKWDGTGEIPHAALLKEIHALGQEIEAVPPVQSLAAKQNILQRKENLPSANNGLVTQTTKTVPDDKETNAILRALSKKVKSSKTKKEQNLYTTIGNALDKWKKNNRVGELPYTGKLAEMGLWNPSLISREMGANKVDFTGESIPAILEKIIEPVEANGTGEVEALVAEGKLYEAIEILEKSAGTDGVSQRLNDLQAKLKSRTERLIEKARQIERNRAKDLAVQKAAWRAVQEFNPDSQEAHEALRAVQQAEIRQRIEHRKKELLQLAEDATRRLDWSVHERVRMEIQALLDEVRSDASLQDLEGTIIPIQVSIEELRLKTGESLQKIPTLVVQGNLREAYKLARELFEQPSHPPVLILQDGSKESLDAYWPYIQKKFVIELKKKAGDYVDEAKSIDQTSPKTARDKLRGALEMLNDEVLTRGDSVILEPQRVFITGEIKKLDERVAIYEQARNLVVEGQSRSLSPSERRERLKKAEQIFPAYPGLSIYLDNVEQDYAGELARKGSEAVVEARHLAFQDSFDQALQLIKTASDTITKAFQNLREGSPLQLALKALDIERETIQQQKVSYADMLQKLPKMDAYLKDYDTSKNAGALKAARTLFADIQRDHPKHRLIQEMNAQLVARQGDPDNWESGVMAYENQEWENAEIALKKIGASFPHYTEAQQLLQRSRAVLCTKQAKEHEKKQEWQQAINNHQRALHIFFGDVVREYPAYGTDPNTEAFAEESRTALERLKKVHENDQRVDEILKDCKDLFESAKRTAQLRHLPVDKVEPIPAFHKIESTLREAVNKLATTRTDKLYALLDEIHATWLETYIDGMKLVSGQTHKNRALLQKANALAVELDEAGLLSGYEELQNRIQADLLDLDYASMGSYKTGINVDLSSMEDNRRKRLSVQRAWPYDVNDPEQIRKHDEKINELERSIREIVDRRMKSDLERRLNQALMEHGSGETETQDAYSAVLQELENDERLAGSVSATTSLIRVAWKAGEWQKAEALARRLRENTGSDFVAISNQWLALGRAAQALAEDKVDDGLEYLEILPTKIMSAEMRAAKNDIENETLLRLINDAKTSGALNTDQGYMEAAQKYAIAYKLAPESQMVLSGLQKIGVRAEKTIMNLCVAAESLQLRGPAMDDLASACREAQAQYMILSGFANVSAHLKLQKAQLDAILDATQSLEGKRNIWEGVKAKLVDFDKELEIAIAQPVKIDPRQNTGGWNLNPLEKYLQDARKIAGRDVQLSRLIENKFTDWNYRKDVGSQLNRDVIALMDAVADEDFDEVISKSVRLEEGWKRAQGDYGFEGLRILIYETYPLGRAETPRDHRDIAVRQKKNLEEWSKWANDVKDKQKTLSELQSELHFHIGEWNSLGDDARASLLERRFSMDDDECLEMPLREVIEQCARGEEDAATFQGYSRAKPLSEPVSKKAQAEADKIESGWTDHLGGFLEYLSALQIEARKRMNEIERDWLPRLRVLVKGVESVASKDGKAPGSTLEAARRYLGQCKRKDPYNRDIDDLEQKLNRFTPR